MSERYISLRTTLTSEDSTVSECVCLHLNCLDQLNSEVVPVSHQISRGMCYPVCGMVHIKEPLLLIGNREAHVAAAGFHSHYLNGPVPYVRRHYNRN